MNTIFIIFIFLQAGGSTYPVFELSAGARAQGMGNAFIAISNDGSAPFFNPAGISEIKKIRILYLHSELSFESTYDYISIVQRPFGISYNRLASYNIPVVELKDTFFSDSSNFYWTNANYLSHSLFLSSGFFTKFFNSGISLKFIETKFYKEKSSGIFLDIGILKRDILNFKNLNFAITAKDLSIFEFTNSSIKEKPLPRLEAGFALLSLFQSGNGERDGLTISFCWGSFIKNKIDNNSFFYNVGMEWFFTQNIPLRAGFEKKSFSFGAGIYSKYVEVDYAFVVHYDIPSSHRFSLGFQF